MLSGILIGTLLVVVGSLFAWRRHAQQRGRERGDPPPSTGDDPMAPRTVPRHDTALDELRAMREALKPAEHSRVERRRPGGAGSTQVPERRRGRPGADSARAGAANAPASDDAEP